MRSIKTDIGLAALISFILMLPFAILEFTFATVTKQDVTSLVILFGLLWLLPMAFIFTLLPIMRSLRARRSLIGRTLLLRVAFLAIIATIWGSLLIDQLPCFLGVPNCD